MGGTESGPQVASPALLCRCDHLLVMASLAHPPRPHFSSFSPSLPLPLSSSHLDTLPPFPHPSSDLPISPSHLSTLHSSSSVLSSSSSSSYFDMHPPCPHPSSNPTPSSLSSTSSDLTALSPPTRPSSPPHAASPSSPSHHLPTQAPSSPSPLTPSPVLRTTSLTPSPVCCTLGLADSPAANVKAPLSFSPATLGTASPSLRSSYLPGLRLGLTVLPSSPLLIISLLLLFLSLSTHHHHHLSPSPLPPPSYHLSAAVTSHHS